MLWIDNDRILVHANNGKLVIYNIVDFKVENIIKTSVENADTFPELYRNNDNQIIYKTGTNKTFIVDTDKCILSSYIETSFCDKYSTIFYSHDKEIEIKRVNDSKALFYKTPKGKWELLIAPAKVIGWID